MASPTSLQLDKFRDDDLLWALEESYDDDGWALSRDVAKKIGLSHRHPAQCVGSRFAWLKRMGILKSKPSEDGDLLWQMTDTGEELLHKRELNKTIEKMLGKLSEAQRVRVTEIIAEAISTEGRSAAHLAQRGWRNRLAGWKDPKLYPSRNGRK